MKNIFLLLVVVVLTACSTASKRPMNAVMDEEVVKSQKAPVWYLNPQESCPESYLCAAGIGDKPGQADSSARNNLALYFKAQVKSNLSSQKYNSTGNKQKDSSWESYGRQINEETEFMLKRSFIDKRLKVGKKSYSYVILDTLQLGREYKEKINKIDMKMLGIISNQERSKYLLLLKLQSERQVLNDSRILIGRLSIPEAVSYEQIAKFKRLTEVKPINKNQKIKILAPASIPEMIRAYIKDNLIESGYVPNSKSDSYYLLKVKYEVKNLYMKVKGFQKYHYRLELKSSDPQNSEVGFVNLETQTVGRNEADAYLKAKEYFRKQLKEEFHKLNL